jgi:hypothetical protein
MVTANNAAPSSATAVSSFRSPANNPQILQKRPCPQGHFYYPELIANHLIFSYDIYVNLSAFAQYLGKICMKD